jgi:hypothetical protein
MSLKTDFEESFYGELLEMLLGSLLVEGPQKAFSHQSLKPIQFNRAK